MIGAGPDGAVLEANLAALARTSPEVARAVRGAAARGDVEFVPTAEVDGAGAAVLSAQIGSGAGARALGSRKRPIEEARRLAEGADVRSAGCLIVSGFGVGHHVAEIARKMGRSGIVLCYEPDVGLLRAVLERVDHSAWLRECNVAVLTDAEDAATLAQTIRGMEEIVALGVTLVAHPPSRERLGEGADRFAALVARQVDAVKMTVVTTMMQVDVTIRNLTSNIDRYVSCPGIGELKDAARGRPAIVVSAGPSLKRNVDLLADPAVRGRFVVVAVQTVLKTLLARGIRPDYVTALDYHEISRRFYEGLTAEDVEGVTLVAEPKANPAILDAFPGVIRCAADGFLDELLGAGARVERAGQGQITPGATVAHLAYYLARHLGCDPVVLIGQDLGFTDGQYYSAGAAIHGVWAGELGPFCTLEMREWERIARMRRSLRPATDVLGRPVYTDEQMLVYLSQFERDFKADAARGLTTLDATEGGVRKQHAEPVTLREVVERFAGAGEAAGLPRAGAVEPGRAIAARERVVAVRRDVWRVGELSRDAARVLRRMLERHDDQGLVNELIGEVDRLGREVAGLVPAYSLVHRLNQTGAFKRLRADRTLQMDATLTPMERQRRQIERDIDNVTWLGDAADELGRILDDAVACLPERVGAPVKAKRTRDPVIVGPGEKPGAGAAEGAGGAERRGTRRVAAIIPVLADRSNLGLSRDLERPFLLGESVLRTTLRRLARCRRLGGVVLLTDDPVAAGRAAGEAIPGLPVVVQGADLRAYRERILAVRSARIWSHTSWRGGIANLTCYDEVLEAPAMAAVMEAAPGGVCGGAGTIDGALLVGADWCFVDPALCDEVIERFEEERTDKPCFTQAPPGLCGMVVARGLMGTLSRAWESGGALASLGGILGYSPAMPIADLIAGSTCPQVEPAVRDSLLRFVPDARPRQMVFGAALQDLGSGVAEAGAATIGALVRQRLGGGTAAGSPPQMVIELCTGRRTSGRRAHWERGSVGAVERRPMPRALAERIIDQLADCGEGGTGRTDAAVTFGGAGDPLLHADVIELVRFAAARGIAGIHVRTDLLCEDAMLVALAQSGAHVVSVDLMADTPETYKAIMGIDRFERATANLERLLGLVAERGRLGGLPSMWVVPRITRCDRTYAEIEPFYDRWLARAGAAVIDALPLAIPGERIAPLPRPTPVWEHELRRRMTVFSDGSVPTGEKNLHATGASVIGNASKESIPTLWRRLTQRRRDLLKLGDGGHPDLQMGY
ncbi:MAG: DUF115 domain-containing protein [Phycisphaeraceae bacterium]|nr:DUF115 domain-containing protein [Phycisphaeraceae bacterium]